VVRPIRSHERSPESMTLSSALLVKGKGGRVPVKAKSVNISYFIQIQKVCYTKFMKIERSLLPQIKELLIPGKVYSISERYWISTSTLLTPLAR